MQASILADPRKQARGVKIGLKKKKDKKCLKELRICSWVAILQLNRRNFLHFLHWFYQKTTSGQGPEWGNRRCRKQVPVLERTSDRRRKRRKKLGRGGLVGKKDKKDRLESVSDRCPDGRYILPHERKNKKRKTWDVRHLVISPLR